MFCKPSFHGSSLGDKLQFGRGNLSHQRSKPEDVFATRDVVYALRVDLGLRLCVTE
jgi:hypothetical protein